MNIGKITAEERKAFIGLLKALITIETSELFNAYAIENVVFGDLKPRDKIPFGKFIEDLELTAWKVYCVRDRIKGEAIAENETIADKEIVFFEKECFIFHMNYVFDTAPQSKRKDDDENGLHPFNKEGLSGYIMRLFPLFRNILATKVEYGFFEIASPFSDRVVQTACYEKIAKFLVAILTRGLRQGGCVDRYLKDLPYLPYYVKRLIKVKRGRFLLANSDVESLDFRLAVLSAIHFMNAEHTQLFELKARKWAGNC